MGGTTNEATKTSTQTSTPWAPAVPALSGILGNVTQINPDLTTTETTAFDQLAANAQNAGQYAPQIAGLANTLFAGGGPDRAPIAQDAYNKYLSDQAATARGDYLDPNKNPFFGATTSGITDQVVNNLSDRFASFGRDPAGAGSFGGVVGREVATALAPTYANAYNTERGRQMDAITGMYGAGSQLAGLLSGLDQTRLGNQQAGIAAADAAITAQNAPQMQALAVEAQRRGIPLQTMQQIMGLVLPAAQAFGTKSGTETSETTQGTNYGQLAVGAATAAAMFF
jgi:hypothetical protein